MLTRTDLNSSQKYLDLTFRLLEIKIVESLSVVSFSDWFNETPSYKLSLPTGLSDSYYLSKVIVKFKNTVLSL